MSLPKRPGLGLKMLRAIGKKPLRRRGRETSGWSDCGIEINRGDVGGIGFDESAFVRDAWDPLTDAGTEEFIRLSEVALAVRRPEDVVVAGRSREDVRVRTGRR